MTACTALSTETRYELRFAPLRERGAVAFPCDVHGSVPLDELDERTFATYLFARALRGFEFAWPEVHPKERT
jgi:hypothetical protein